jgi:hypothetical protein
MKIQTGLRSGEQSPMPDSLEAAVMALLQSNNNVQLTDLLRKLDPGQVQALMAQMDPEQRAMLIQFYITPR